MLHKFHIIFCFTLYLTAKAARHPDLLGEGEDYQYGLDLSKLEDELIDQAAVVDDKIFLQHLLSKWKTSTTTTDYPMEESSTETTATTTPETTTTTTTTTEPTTTSTTTEESTSIEVEPDTTDTTSKQDNRRNNVYVYEKTNPIPMGVQHSPVAQQQPTFSYYPVAQYNIPPPLQQIPQMIQTLPGMQAISTLPQTIPALPQTISTLPQTITTIPQTMPGFHTIPQLATVQHLPQTLLAMSGISQLPTFNPYAQYPLQFISPVYNPYRHFKK